ncbi:hypothetical protein PENTCL1PPCAC_28015, partial [Pristionchus entomophagus]
SYPVPSNRSIDHRLFRYSTPSFPRPTEPRLLLLVAFSIHPAEMLVQIHQYMSRRIIVYCDNRYKKITRNLAHKTYRIGMTEMWAWDSCVMKEAVKRSLIDCAIFLESPMTFYHAKARIQNECTEIIMQIVSVMGSTRHVNCMGTYRDETPEPQIQILPLVSRIPSGRRGCKRHEGLPAATRSLRRPRGEDIPASISSCSRDGASACRGRHCDRRVLQRHRTQWPKRDRQWMRSRVPYGSIRSVDCCSRDTS